MAMMMTLLFFCDALKMDVMFTPIRFIPVSLCDITTLKDSITNINVSQIQTELNGINILLCIYF